MLSKGQNLSLPADVEQIDVVLGWTESDVEVDASALLLNADRKVRSDADFVFYNQPESTDGSIRFLGASGTEEGAQARIAIDLSAVPDDVHTVALGGSVAAGGFGDLGKLASGSSTVPGTRWRSTSLPMPPPSRHSYSARCTAAMATGRFGRSGRAGSPGWAGLATDFGVDIDDDQDPELTATADTPSDSEESAVVAPPGSTGDAPQLVPELPTTPAAQRKATTRGVRTAKRAVKKSKPLVFGLAEQDTWQPARLFSVIGVGAGEEQERRATSALIATMQAVRPFARAVCARVGLPRAPSRGTWRWRTSGARRR